MKQLFLLRGLPGSGKSALADSLTGGAGSVHFEADMYFVRDGEYKFDATQLKNAHNWCRNEVEYAMQFGHRGKPINSLLLDSIVVSNTFTQEWEMKPYYELAEKYGYQVFSLIVENRHGGTNVHYVPQETIEKMKNRFEIKL